MAGVYRALVGKTERREPLGRARRRWEDNIKMDWIDVAQYRERWRALVNAAKNLRVP
jgi:hypothetical protein